MLSGLHLSSADRQLSIHYSQCHSGVYWPPAQSCTIPVTCLHGLMRAHLRTDLPFHAQAYILSTLTALLESLLLSNSASIILKAFTARPTPGLTHESIYSYNHVYNHASTRIFTHISLDIYAAPHPFIHPDPRPETHSPCTWASSHQHVLLSIRSSLQINNSSCFHPSFPFQQPAGFPPTHPPLQHPTQLVYLVGTGLPCFMLLTCLPNPSLNLAQSLSI